MDKIKDTILTAAKDELDSARDREETMMLQYRGFRGYQLENKNAEAEDNLLGHIKYETRMEEAYAKMLVYAETDNDINFHSEYTNFLTQAQNARFCAEDFKQAIKINEEKFQELFNETENN